MQSTEFGMECAQRKIQITSKEKSGIYCAGKQVKKRKNECEEMHCVTNKGANRAMLVRFGDLIEIQLSAVVLCT